MGSVYGIKCDNCYFFVTTEDYLVKSMCESGLNLDYSDDLFCLDCQKVVKVWRCGNGKSKKNIPKYIESNVFFKIYLKSIRIWQHIRKDRCIGNKCPKCGSNNVFFEIPDNIKVKCPKCNKGILTSEVILLTD